MNLTCSKNLDRPCTNEAVELLLTIDSMGMAAVRPRCALHPASEDVAMMQRLAPSPLLVPGRIVIIDLQKVPSEAIRHVTIS